MMNDMIFRLDLDDLRVFSFKRWLLFENIPCRLCNWSNFNLYVSLCQRPNLVQQIKKLSKGKCHDDLVQFEIPPKRIFVNRNQKNNGPVLLQTTTSVH